MNILKLFRTYLEKGIEASEISILASRKAIEGWRIHAELEAVQLRVLIRRYANDPVSSPGQAKSEANRSDEKL